MTLLDVLKRSVLARAEACGTRAEAEQLILEQGGDLLKRSLVLATVAAVQDGILMSGLSGLGEEHQTASFMGHLGTHLRWSMWAQAWSREDEYEFQPPDVCWANHPPPVETRTGADFGIVVRSGEDPLCRVSLFQAKLDRAKPGGLTPKIKINQLCGRSKDRSERSDAHLGEMAKYADRPMGCWPSWLEESVNRTNPRPRYQIEALMKSNLVGNLNACDTARWCHYVAWPVGQRFNLELRGGPKVASVVEVGMRKFVGGRSRPTVYDFEPGSPTLTTVIAALLTKAIPKHYIEVRLSTIEDLLGKLAVLLPGVGFMSVDQGSDGALRQTFERMGWRLSEAAPREPPITIQTPVAVPTP